MKTLEQLVNEIGEAMTGINTQTGAAQERLGVKDVDGALKAVLGVSDHATVAGLANQEIMDNYVKGIAPAPVDPGTPGQPPNPKLPGQFDIRELDEEDKKYLAMGPGKAASKVYATQMEINQLINQYFDPAGGFDVNAYQGKLKV